MSEEKDIGTSVVEKKAETEEKDAKTSSVEKGAFIFIDFVARVKDTNEIVDLTLEDVAKKEKIYREDGTYQPRFIVVGEGWMIEVVDEGLVGFTEGEEKKLEIPPEKAFGQRVAEKSKTIPIREFRKQGIRPRTGMIINYKGIPATITSVSGGRIRLDLNHPLAGKTLIYDVTVKEILRTEEEKLKALVSRRIPANLEEIEVENVERGIEIYLPEETFLMEGLQFAKKGIARDIQRFIIEKPVFFIEKYEKED